MIINRCFVNETLEKLLKDGWAVASNRGRLLVFFLLAFRMRRSTQN